MGDVIREICILSVLLGTVCSIAPEGPVKTVMAILSSVILMFTIIKPVSQMDIPAYAAALAKYHEMEAQLTLDGETMNERLNRVVIEDEYKAYIRDKAAEQGIALEDVKLQMSWNTDGYWMPVGAELYLKDAYENMPRLGSILESELGISREKQRCIIVH